MPASPLQWAWLDDGFVAAADARVSAFDRGFLFGDGVYEVIPVYGGHPFRVEAHLERLARSRAGIGLHVPWDDAWLTQCIAGLVERNGGGDQSLYLQVTRGAEFGRDHRYPESLSPTLFMFTTAMPPRDPAVDRDGVAAITAEDNRWARCDLKTTSLLANVLLRQHAHERGADEVILHRDGRLTEASVSNVYLVDDGTVRTPPLGRGLLPGVTRIVVLELCDELGIAVDVTPVEVDALGEADELWISSSTKELAPIGTLDGESVGNGRPGPLYARVREAFDRLVGRA